MSSTDLLSPAHVSDESRGASAFATIMTTITTTTTRFRGASG
jgi:hypothetical protein